MTCAPMFGKELAQFAPSFSSRTLGSIAGKKQAQIISKSPVDGFLEVDLQNARRDFFLRRAALKGTLRTGE